jgi:hypothetical protein
MLIDSIKNHLSYREPGRSQTGKRQSIDVHTGTTEMQNDLEVILMRPSLTRRVGRRQIYSSQHSE